uniref:RT_RNaseH domain-containing protein n=1 Tax=Heterorhabditis bacteriophora TaxID=37862 RepID=A0A1I7WFZ2_HETBA
MKIFYYLRAAKWSATHIELFPAIFKSTIYGQHTKILSDHKPLTFLLKHKKTHDNLARWIIELQSCDVCIEYLKGSSNVIQKIRKCGLWIIPLNRKTSSSFQFAFRKNPYYHFKRKQLYVPTKLKEPIFLAFHSNAISGGHFNWQKTLKNIFELFNLVRSFNPIYFDLTGPIHKTEEGNEYIVCMIDHFSKFVIKSLPSSSAILISDNPHPYRLNIFKTLSSLARAIQHPHLTIVSISAPQSTPKIVHKNQVKKCFSITGSAFTQPKETKTLASIEALDNLFQKKNSYTIFLFACVVASIISFLILFVQFNSLSIFLLNLFFFS